MAWINPIEMNMNISRNVYESRPSYRLSALVQKIALYTIVPITLIAIFEAVVKNLIVINLANMSIVVLNKIHSAMNPEERTLEATE